MFVGYVRVSTQEQSLQLQLDVLEAAGCEKIFTVQTTKDWPRCMSPAAKIPGMEVW